MTDRDAQVRRLAEAIRGASAFDAANLARHLVEVVGARMPEPAPPTIVVSEEAIQAVREAAPKWWNRLSDPECRAFARAAFPIMLRDTVNALPRWRMDPNHVTIHDPTAPNTPYVLAPEHLIRALGGAA